MKSRWLAKSTIKATLSKYAQRNLIFRKKKWHVVALLFMW